MKFTAFVATLGLLLACGMEPEPPDVPRIEAVSIAPFHSQHLFEVKVVDAGSTAMKRLVEHVALDRERKVITGETERWQRDGGAAEVDFFLAGPTRADLEQYLASTPSLVVPRDRALAFGRLDDGRWRTYLVSAQAELDGGSIEHVDITRDDDLARVKIDLTPDGGERLHALTTRAVGAKLAVLANGTVIAAPVIATPIEGRHAEVTLPGFAL